MDMIVCEECGCVVHPDFLTLHSDWHDYLVQRNDPVDTLSTPHQMILD